MFRNLDLKLSETWAAFSTIEKKNIYSTSPGEDKSQQDLWRLNPYFLAYFSY